MPINPDNDSNMPLARRIVQEWLAANNRKPIWLAQQACVSRSMVSRFLAGKPLDVGSALKIYSAMQWGMAIEQKLELLRAFGLLSLALAVHNSLSATPAPEQTQLPGGDNAAGTRLLAEARELSDYSWAKRLSIYNQAERVLGSNAVSASKAGIESLQLLINLGNFSQAENEHARVTTLYEHLFGANTKLHVSHLAGWVHFGRRDLDRAITAFNSTLQLAYEYDMPYYIHNAEHFLGMTYTRQGKRARISTEAERYFGLADDCLRKAVGYSAVFLHPYALGFDYFRQSQLFAAMGRYADANNARRKARDIFQGQYFAEIQIDIEEMNLQLKDGNTRLPHERAEEGLSIYERLGYAQGLARSARILMLASVEERKPVEALTKGIAAVMFNPYVTLDEGSLLRDLVIDINCQISRQMDGRQRSQLLHRIRDDAMERRGIFGYLDAVAINREDVMNRLFTDPGINPGMGVQ